VVALDRAEEFAAPVRAGLEQRRDACVAALREAGFQVEPPLAAMYLWVALPPGVESLPFARRALEEEGVAVLGGAAFGPAGEGYFRIALTAGPDRLREAVARLGRVMSRAREERLVPTA
jgi:aspartate/methionine/tyrosine aminotransferase